MDSRTVPTAISAEQAVLGGLMLSSSAMDKVVDTLVAADFYRRDHRLIFEAMAALNFDQKPFDVVTLGDWFRTNDRLEAIGGIEYLAGLANNTPSAANIDAYAGLVRDASLRRTLADAGTAITGEALGKRDVPIETLLGDAERTIFTISERGARARHGPQAMRSVARQTFQELRRRSESDGPSGLPTGLSALDAIIGGLNPSDFALIAARPSLGKTALAIDIGSHVSLKVHKSVAVFSMEMSASQLGFRLLSSISGVPQDVMRTGDLSEAQWAEVVDAQACFGTMKMFIDDTAALSPVELRARARRLKREHAVDLIIIDYLQLMQIPGHHENRTAEISIISRELKALAKELHIPVVALSQLNRNVEQRADKRPALSDLRDSGAIEQDADVVMFIYRDEYYNKDTETPGVAELIISKQRNGPTGTAIVRFDGAHTTFRDIDPFAVP